MRFIGNKENLVEKIYQVLETKGIKGDSFFDFFAGTTSVGQYFKKKGYQVFSSDLLYFSYVLQRAYIQNNEIPTFEQLLPKIPSSAQLLFSTPLQQVIAYMDSLPPQEGFIFQHYTPEGTAHLPQPRMYFSSENGKKIDAVRQQIECWKNENVLTENEYFILLACLIETVPFYANISGVYAAFQKIWDVRALKPLKLRNIETILSKHQNTVFNVDSVSLASEIRADIFYLDPPYNQRQYAPNYHVLETIAQYDHPEISGVSGLRPYSHQKSQFCNATTALQALREVAQNAQCKHLVLSYNSEGIMPIDPIEAVLSEFGKVECVEFDYLRFKSNSNGLSNEKKFVSELVFLVGKC